MTRRVLLFTFACTLAACGGSAARQPGAPGQHVDETDAAWAFERARASAARGDSIRAEQYLTMALSRGYPRSKLLPLLLKVCLESSRLRAALNHAQLYLLEHPEDEALRFLVANIHVALRQEAEAHTELNRLVRHNPENADAHYLLGVLASESRPQRAVEHFRRYVALAPSSARAAEVRTRLSDLLAATQAHAAAQEQQ